MNWRCLGEFVLGCRRLPLRRFIAACALASLSIGEIDAQTVNPPPIDPAVTAIWRNPDAPTPDRVKALMSQLTMKEKISLINWLAPAIDRLGIPEYNHGNEGLHGLVRPGSFTVFPEAIGLGATFDPDMIHAMTSAISDEARAKWNASHGQHLGRASDVLTLWSPVVNMARDPRWGRTQETYGEDPSLTGRASPYGRRRQARLTSSCSPLAWNRYLPNYRSLDCRR